MPTTSPDLELSFDELIPSTDRGARLLATLTALLPGWGVLLRGELPAAARIRATTSGTPHDHLSPGVYLAGHGDGVVLVWHTATPGVHVGPGRGPAFVDAQDLLAGLVATLENYGTVGPLSDRLDNAPTFRAAFRITEPGDADALAVLIEDADS